MVKPKLLALLGRLAQFRRLPLALAMVAMVFMAPALPTGLIGDDLIQRPKQFRAADLPPRLLETGFVPADSGSLKTVLRGLFGYNPNEKDAAGARNYGIAPWWSDEAWTAALWRPLTAFTHWLDYRLFPDTPLLMHAHNIFWYAAAVFLAATLYRRVVIISRGRGSSFTGSHVTIPDGTSITTEGMAAALAGCLFLFDKNTYMPVLYVANRGFIMALVFGLLTLHSHMQWRARRSTLWAALAAFCFLLALLANEGGASTLAFLVAYALVLDSAPWQQRLVSLLPAGFVLLVWRIIYVACGFGVRNLTAYIDPGYSPALFLSHIVSRVSALLGGQLSGLPPELVLALSPSARIFMAFFFGGFVLLSLAAAWPVLRHDRVAAFWAAAMGLAAIPAATVTPISKNLGFVAVGAFGWVAAFLVRSVSTEQPSPNRWPLRLLGGSVAAWLIVAHIPAALGARLLLARVSHYLPEAAVEASDLQLSPDIGNHRVVILNDPGELPALVTFNRAYHRKPLPINMRVLVPGILPFQLTRTGERSLLVTAHDRDLFDCQSLGAIHVAYALRAINDLLFARQTWNVGDRVTCAGFLAEVRALSARGAPTSIAFEFDRSLDSAGMVWVYFDWRHFTHLQFRLPGIGQSVEIAGPSGSRTAKTSGRAAGLTSE